MFLNLDLICPRHLGKHYDEVNITLLDHGPEVVDGVGHGPLGGDVKPLTLSHRGRNVAGIDIAKLVVFVTEYLDTVLIIRNNIFKPGAQFLSNVLKSGNNRNKSHLFLGRFSERVATELLQWLDFFLGIFSNSLTTSPSASLASREALHDSLGILAGQLKALS
jgi:hypothetical protein